MNRSQFANELLHLPDYFAHHVFLTVAALVLGIAFSLPLAALAVRRPGLAAPLLAVASAVQTIPGLALLALMVPLLGRIGVVPALVALVLYSMLPILRNTVTGALGIDPDVVEAARGIGMTENQILARVRFPLAAPVIVAGIRTAAVWTVGMATLSTPVGATSLGNFIFSGLQTQNTTAVLIGCAGAATLALSLDGLIRLFEAAARRRDTRLAWLATIALVVAMGLAILPLVSRDLQAGQRPLVTVGAKTFTEQYILAALIADRLEASGFDVRVRQGLGSTIAFEALANDEIDVYVDYSGTLWANQMKRPDPARAEIVLEELVAWLEDRHGIRLLGALGFENAYALAMTRTRAERLGITSLTDLARRSPELSIGGDYEFFARPEWITVRDRYGMRFREERSFDSTLMYSAVAEGQVDVISAFSTDGRIDAFDLRVLEDPRQAFPPYDAVVLVAPSAARDPALVASLRTLVGRIDDEQMRAANRRVDLDHRPIAEVAKQLALSIDGGHAGSR
ncbi:MAG TPA: ABC transporter permease subunit [Deltaproteobacteria bacterium]|nr:ABC transporter permease subunit [Deltaproteobacteria bacterium]